MSEKLRIGPWDKNRCYWQYHGKPILLIGASDEDNLYNHPDIPPDGLEAHLDRMVAAGGNYVRNTMSCRDEGNIYPYIHDKSTGKYDLRKFNPAYWQRFEHFLEMASERQIIVQIELWDRFDYARECWEANPFNPKNNINADATSMLPARIDTHPSKLENPFFRSPPNLENYPPLLAMQENLIRKTMDVSLEFDNVLYCISNETNDSEQWSTYWAEFIRTQAKQHGMEIEVTEMWDNWDVHDPIHLRTFDHPDRYNFVDISQNSQQVGQRHYDNLQWVRHYLSNNPRPINNVKMYGGKHGGGPEEGQHKLWRNILGGAASARYHRPGSGMGLNDVTQAHLRSLRKILEKTDIFSMQPANEFLRNRSDDGAYLMAEPGRQYVIYMPHGGSVTVNLTGAKKIWRLQWLNVLNNLWEPVVDIQTDDNNCLHLITPEKYPVAATILPKQ